ncbi:glycoside hydrolase family 32 protein [Aestuariimicrobium soli]|uniref:glycoside hydrolase family 32 protein n=1 Tax=Aestuariimicrobium soli TaxID=2035834 RepID=UPI003EC07B55
MSLPATRPALHLMADTWINDPNGLVHADGVWHAFFQHNPSGPSWGNMSWGHATSTDLLTWTPQPVALPNTADHACFSGSAVHDVDDTAGFGAGALVALYTAAHEPGSPHAGLQTQFVAHSRDHVHFTRSESPVLDRNSAHFRDPKVVRWQGDDEAYWVLAAVEAVDNAVVLYRSDDLQHWTPLSEFRFPGLVSPQWECPDLFPLEVDGRRRWIMIVSVNPGAIQVGSGTRWFLGDFDGVTFTADEAHPSSGGDPAWPDGCWLDWGSDNYASVTFSGVPATPGGPAGALPRTVMMGWHDNWDYAFTLADDGFPGMLTVPREVSWVADDRDPARAGTLRQWPVRELFDRLGEQALVKVAGGPGGTFTAPAVGFTALTLTDQQELTIGSHRLSWVGDELTLTRAPLPLPSGNELPAKAVRAPLRPGLTELEVGILTDHGSLELFCDGGRTALASLALGESGARPLSWTGTVARVRVARLS